MPGRSGSATPPSGCISLRPLAGGGGTGSGREAARGVSLTGRERVAARASFPLSRQSVGTGQEQSHCEVLSRSMLCLQ